MCSRLMMTVIVLSLSFSLCSGQNVFNDSLTTVIAYWNKGESKSFKFFKGRLKYENNELISSGSSTSDLLLTVIDSTETSYTIKWLIIDIHTEEDDNPIVKDLIEMSKGLSIIYTTDELGIFSELINWREIQGFLNIAMDKLLLAKNEDKDFVEAFSKIRKTFSTKQAIEQVMINEIQLYHAPYGVIYKLNEIIEEETELPNILGGQPFPAILTCELTKIDMENSSCILKMSTIMNSEKSTEIIYNFIKEMSETMGNPPSEKSEIPLISINDYYEFEIDLISGWTTRAYYERVVVSDTLKQVDIYEITAGSN